MSNTTNFWASVVHAVVQGLVWILPLAVLALGKYGDLTVSSILSLAVAYVNNKYLHG